jgi:hypothetical protein
MNKVTVVIRSVGERTEAVCRHLIAQQVPEENVAVVSNAPFSETLKDSFRVGIERGLPWTLCVDADVLPRPHSIAELMKVAQDLPGEVCEVQGQVLDKFFGGPRDGGYHLYRTSLLPVALHQVPSEGVDIRPETHTLRAMAARGYPFVKLPLVVGIHDFHQYYRDIYRKCLVQAHKHLHHANGLVSYWRRMAGDDPDFRMGLLGLAAGIAQPAPAVVDVRAYPTLEDVPGLGVEWQEKSPLTAGSLSGQEIEELVSGWVRPEEYFKLFPRRAATESPQRTPSMAQRVSLARSRMGNLKAIPWMVGWGLHHSGKVIMDYCMESGKIGKGRNGRPALSDPLND